MEMKAPSPDLHFIPPDKVLFNDGYEAIGGLGAFQYPEPKALEPRLDGYRQLCDACVPEFYDYTSIDGVHEGSAEAFYCKGIRLSSTYTIFVSEQPHFPQYRWRRRLN